MTEIIHPGFTQHTARLEQSWSRWHKRGLMAPGRGRHRRGCPRSGRAGLCRRLLAEAAAATGYHRRAGAARDGERARPAAPQVTVNVPQQPAPIVNVTVPEARPAPTLPQASAPTRDGKTVTDFAVFHHR